MAATQAESQQNDVHSEVKCIQKHSQIGVNNVVKDKFTTNDELSCNAVLKYVNRSGRNSPSLVEMSQYREDISGHPTAAGAVYSEQNIIVAKSSKESSLGVDHTSKGETIDAHATHPHGFVGNTLGGSGGREYNSDEFSSKQSVSEGSTGHSVSQCESSEEHYLVSKMESPRLSHSNPPVSTGFPGQSPRFLSGQSISQATGPTPTLNQLLQASSPVHRFHSNYPGMGSEPYQQPWPMQRPPVVPPVYPQPGQRPPQTVSTTLRSTRDDQVKELGFSETTTYALDHRPFVRVNSCDDQLQVV